jgi:hypothetical protein
LASWSTPGLLHGGDRGDRAAAILIALVGLTILLVIEALGIQRGRLRSDASDHRERKQQRENDLHGRSSFYGGDVNSTALSLSLPSISEVAAVSPVLFSTNAVSCAASTKCRYPYFSSYPVPLLPPAGGFVRALCALEPTSFAPFSFLRTSSSS